MIDEHEHESAGSSRATGNGTGAPGRDPSTGRFSSGNAFGVGNAPHGRRVQRWRALFVEEVSDDDLRAAIRSLVNDAKSGDRRSRRELLDRVLGKPGALEAAERHEQLLALASLLNGEALA